MAYSLCKHRLIIDSRSIWGAGLVEHALCTVIRRCIVAIVRWGGPKRRQRLIGPRNVSGRISRRALSDRLVDVLHSLKHTLMTDPWDKSIFCYWMQRVTELKQIQIMTMKENVLCDGKEQKSSNLCSSLSGFSRLNSFLIVPSISAARES